MLQTAGPGARPHSPVAENNSNADGESVVQDPHLNNDATKMFPITPAIQGQYADSNPSTTRYPHGGAQPTIAGTSDDSNSPHSSPTSIKDSISKPPREVSLDHQQDLSQPSSQTKPLPTSPPTEVKSVETGQPKAPLDSKLSSKEEPRESSKQPKSPAPRDQSRQELIEAIESSSHGGESLFNVTPVLAVKSRSNVYFLRAESREAALQRAEALMAEKSQSVDFMLHFSDADVMQFGPGMIAAVDDTHRFVILGVCHQHTSNASRASIWAVPELDYQCGDLSNLKNLEPSRVMKIVGEVDQFNHDSASSAISKPPNVAAKKRKVYSEKKAPSQKRQKLYEPPHVNTRSGGTKGNVTPPPTPAAIKDDPRDSADGSSPVAEPGSHCSVYDTLTDAGPRQPAPHPMVSAGQQHQKPGPLQSSPHQQPVPLRPSPQVPSGPTAPPSAHSYAPVVPYMQQVPEYQNLHLEAPAPSYPVPPSVPALYYPPFAPPSAPQQQTYTQLFAAALCQQSDDVYRARLALENQRHFAATDDVLRDRQQELHNLAFQMLSRPH